MNKLVVLLLPFLLLSCARKSISIDKIDAVLQNASDQYLFMSKNLPDGRYPKTFYADKDVFETSKSDWWVSGFYPGSLLYLKQALNTNKFDSEINRILGDLQKEQYNTTTHDLGFMMFCSFGMANKIARNPEYEKILLNSAKSLASRFNDDVGCIKSWDSSDDSYLVIIDNMMNLELLFWASEFTGDSSFHDIALKHAETTIENHFRQDFSSYHVINYDANTGRIKEKRTAQGYADESAWARGQAWGLYGFTVMYRATGQQKYLNQAIGIANYLINHPNFPKDKVPYWDFNAPDIPKALRDSSAGAIMASALLELNGYVDKKSAKTYKSNAVKILTTLISDDYLATNKTNGGFILKHGVGHIPENSEVDVPLSYGDYYLIEALIRYKNMQSVSLK